MHLCIVVPSADFVATAGVRIRYLRLQEAFEIQGDMLAVAPIERIMTSEINDAEIFVFSKTYSMAAFVLARRLKELGKIVGLDIFDDYFSQKEDARLVFFRDWMATCGPIFDFSISSTPVLHRFLAQIMPGKPSIVLPDAAPTLDIRRLIAFAREKTERALSTRRLEVLWFGIGDNPFFTIGLKDLAAFGIRLAEISRRHWDVELTILTNDEALDANALRNLATLGVPYVLETWSEQAETAALARATVCFLPVNAQAFSRAKSLNRAISALAAGCQVLTPGFPLYHPLDSVVYTSAREFLTDFDQGTLKLGSIAAGKVADLFETVANPHHNSVAFRDLVGPLLASRRGAGASAPKAVPPLSGSGLRFEFPRPIAIVHGIDLDVQAHKAAGRLGALSIRSPLTKANVNYDLSIHMHPSRTLEIAVKPKFFDRLRPAFLDFFLEAPVENDFAMVPASSLGFLELPEHIAIACLGSSNVSAVISLYDPILAHVVVLCRQLLLDHDICVSDRSRTSRWTGEQPMRIAG